MTQEKQPIRYKDIADTPADRLLALSHAELRALIHQARAQARQARTLTNWLIWIKAEKMLREEAWPSSEQEERS